MGTKTKMAYEKMHEHLCRQYVLSNELWEAIADCSERLILPKNYVLQEIGKECSYIYYIVDGFCSFNREMPKNNNSDTVNCVIEFAGMGEFCTAFHCFWKKTKSPYSIETTERSELIRISRNDFEILCNKYPELLMIYNMSNESVQQRILEKKIYLRYDSKYRIKHFLEGRSIQNLLKHVSQRTIALYLHMTEQTFSKMLAELNKEMT